ncbi:hypothetical protein K1Y80_00240 [Streptomyces sp. MAG02]|nr:hypothetical protein [Streptomyces sp. MAG02]
MSTSAPTDHRHTDEAAFGTRAAKAPGPEGRPADQTLPHGTGPWRTREED